MCRGIIQMLPLLDLKNDCKCIVLLFNKNARILITESAGSKGVYRAVFDRHVKPYSVRSYNVTCQISNTVVASRLKRSIIMRSFSMFHRLRNYADIKKYGIAQLSYEITYSRGGGDKYTVLYKKIRKNRGDEGLAMGILQGSRGCMLSFLCCNQGTASLYI